LTLPPHKCERFVEVTTMKKEKKENQVLGVDKDNNPVTEP
jgi:hypothetical protein